MIDNLDDLWHLYNLIEKHDTVGSKTYRRQEKADDKIRPEKAPKKPIWLAIDVEEVEFHEFSNRLRVLGIIVKGPEELGLKSHHTLNFTAGDTIEIEKPEAWRGHQIGLLKSAVEGTNQPKVIIIAMEDDNAVIGQLHQYGIRQLATIEHSGGGKFYSEKKSAKASESSLTGTKKEFFSSILTQINHIWDENIPLILVGPGFTKDEFIKFCRDKHLPGIDNILQETIGQSGMVGIQEAIRRGIVKRLVQDSRVAFETELVDKLLEGIGNNGAVSYGLDETENAATAGAVESLLVIDKLIRKKDDRLEKIMTTTESSGGKVVIISTVHDAGKQLEALGGVASLLRYKF
jgi:protein pelota